ncbi:hypothetical protein PO909_015846, partial [Leuciscus waleckii]
RNRNKISLDYHIIDTLTTICIARSYRSYYTTINTRTTSAEGIKNMANVTTKLSSLITRLQHYICHAISSSLHLTILGSNTPCTPHILNSVK